ncbi:FAD-dependent monooxygenase [Chitinophaga sancti]|uniref:2-polyprenyl-6-methoxyphenol hydroxylase n=1 Tax=Chitinophaga sancti TaxID=1004 RepID=A0A1K1PLN5_9BACT|nr:FAD-dependent monooxygenase [Chitinophaga sancti]WQD59522.1 FAD-dependent oxidoreductase [Chitinophaga sancti]WQG88343.1 FAD-dependent oxidoreductase [Chitinophaga sancti]SFW48640.1 2-polyprenyl-6-methoxyphenol hydroxylase [Chitinophaga sancti]
MKQKIIISGGGIAGLTVAKFLTQQGHHVTVLERASSFSKSGFLISLKSFGISIMDELGLTDQLREASSPSEFVNFRESNDEIIQGISYEKMNQDIERSVLITRGGLHHVLYNDLKDSIAIRLSAGIGKLAQSDNEVKITLQNGEELEADLLIVSEGLRSTTRQSYFPESVLEDFNVLYMGGRLKGPHAYEVGKFNVYIDVNRMLSIYPIAQDEIAIQCYIHDSGNLTSIQHKANELLTSSFNSYNNEIQHLLHRFVENGIMFIDKMGMVNSPNLVNGNVVLLGDAGYCPTALSGMGASLSIYGAKALAHFIKEQPNDLKTACSNYNTMMQPLIRKFQGNAKNNAASFIPDSQEKLNRFVLSFRAASDVDMQKIMTAPIVLTEDQLNFKISER